MSAGDVQLRDVLAAYNRIDWPSMRIPPDSEQAVQDAAHNAIEALDQLSIECNIASAREKARAARDSATRQENFVSELMALRKAPRPGPLPPAGES